MPTATTNLKQLKDLAVFAEKDDFNSLDKVIVFKELTEKDELLQMFALRYLVYRYVNFIKPNINELDIDCYDRYSTYLGAYEVSGKIRRLIGSVRIIRGDQESKNAPIVDEIAHSFEDYESLELLHRPAIFPIMETFDLPEEYLYTFSLDRENKKCINYKEMPYEISRLAVIPEYWGAKENIEKGIRDLIIFYSWKSQPRKYRYLIATHPRTRKRYERLGFKIIPGCPERLYRGINRPAIAMAIDMNIYFNDLEEIDQDADTSHRLSFEHYIGSGQIIQNSE